MKYEIRINVKKQSSGRYYSTVNLSENVIRMFEKPYVSVKRMQDRLAFVPWDNKTGHGIVVVNNGMLQFGKQTDCEKMLDFCGEYDVVNKTDSGIVFIKLEDKRPLSLQFDKVDSVVKTIKSPAAAGTMPQDHSGYAPAAKTVIPSGTSSLTDLLGKAIEEKQKELDAADKEIELIKTGVLANALAKRERINAELQTYCAAYTLANKKENDDDRSF